jgi:lysophospholipid acyltransferase (LPLAT)-like uncharacterized protein
VAGEARSRGGARAGASTFREQHGWRQWLWVAAAAWLIAVVLRLVYLTLRVRLVDESDAFGRRRHGGERVIAAFWHDGLMLAPLVFTRFRWPGTVTALLSQHRDAELAARALGHLGIASERGSATRGMLGGLRGLLRAAGRGDDLVVVPDGPRGPRHEAKEGLVQLARATGLQLLPIGAAAWPARRLRSWDRLQVPRPFARVALVLGPAVAVARDADAAAQAAAEANLARQLARVSAAALAAVGAPPA